MILNIYDILKKTRKNIKINDKLGKVDRESQYACDEAVKEYQVINHKDKTQKKMLFKINTQMQKRQLTVIENVQIRPELLEEMTEEASSQ